MENYSYKCGQGREDVIYTTLPALLDQRAHDMPDKPAFVFRYQDPDRGDDMVMERKMYTFREMAAVSKRLASAFLDIGIKPKDKLVMVGSNCPEYLFVEFACLRLSVLMIRIPLDFGTVDVLLNVLKKHGVSTLILDDHDLAEKVTNAAPEVLKQDQQRCGYCMQNIIILKSSVQTSDWKSIKELLEFGTEADRVMEIQNVQDPDDECVTYPTSGSTGEPKHVMISHYSMINAMQLIFDTTMRSITSDFVHLNDRPFTWLTGLQHLVLYGITMVQLQPKVLLSSNETKKLFQIANEENVSGFLCTPYVIYDIMQAMKTHELERPLSLKLIMTGGEVIPLKLLQFAKDIFDNVVVGYGSTEVVAISNSNQQRGDGKHVDELLWHNIYPGVELKIVDDSGKLIKRGQAGLIKLRSRFSFSGYLNDNDATIATKSTAGWVSLGDQGIMNANGQIKIVGRTKDVISRGGNKVYPIVIENALVNHPKVSKVAVVGIPDPRLYNEICAFIIPKQGSQLREEELQKYIEAQICKEGTLVKPKYYIFLDEFRKTHAGKLDKKWMVQFAVDHLKLE